MLMKTRLPIVLGVAALAFLPTESPACTRAVYLGPEGMTVTGRTMDWREDPLTNLYIFPRGTARRGANTDNTVFWTSKYGTLSAAGYDIGITDGMNEAGLVANLHVVRYGHVPPCRGGRLVSLNCHLVFTLLYWLCGGGAPPFMPIFGLS